MLLKDIALLSKLLGRFLTRFACCFARPAGRKLLQIYVRGLLSDVQRKNAEARRASRRTVLCNAAFEGIEDFCCSDFG